MYFEPSKKTYYRFPSASSVLDLDSRYYFPEKPSHTEADTRYEASFSDRISDSDIHHDL
jgi:hypothetical protein